MAGRGTHSRNSAWPTTDQYTFLGSPLNKTVDDLTPQATVPTPTRRATRGLKRQGISNIRQYGGFQKNGIEYRLGDCVLLETDEQDEPYKAKIISCYQNEEGEGRLKVRWLYKEKDVKRTKRGKAKDQFDSDQNEIFYSNEKDITDIENVCGRLEVLSKEEFDERYPNNVGIEEHIYFCHRRWDDRRGRVVSGLRWDDFMHNRDIDDEEPRPRPATIIVNSRKRRAPSSKQSQEPKQKIKKRRTNQIDVGDKEDSDNEVLDDGRDENFAPDPNAGSEGEETITEEEVESDVEYTQQKRKEQRAPLTPRKNRRATSRSTTPSKVRTPRKNIGTRTPSGRSRGGTMTPTMGSARKTKLAATPLPERFQERATPRSEFERARERLHVSVVPELLPCREDEFAEIYGEIESAIEEGTGGCIYISGVPGTGKTATVHAVMRALEEAAEQEQISPFQFVEINGMKLTEPAQSYSLLWEAITGNKVTAAHANELLQKRMHTPSPNRQPLVVLMDELDLLVTKNQKVMYDYFHWPASPHARLIVIAVANTMDLPERILTNRVSSRLGLTRINFQPYTHQQLIEIVQSRLEGVNCFRKDAVEFCARKVSAIAGDARRALDICRRGVEIMELTQANAEKSGKAFDKRLVTMSVIDRAVKEMFSSPAVQAVTRASTHQRIFLVAVVRLIRRSGTSAVEYGQVMEEHIRICKLGGVTHPMPADLAYICSQLSTSRVMLAEKKRAGDRCQKVELAINEEDVITAIRNGGETWLRKLAATF